MFKQSTVTFLKNLSKNNNKVWFDEHRSDFMAAKNDFEEFVQQLIKTTAGFDDTIKELQVKNCTFRINRDIRFAKDKTPYKTNMGASINIGGKKSVFAGYYFHLEPAGKSFAGGGLWMPMAQELKKVRQEIDYNFDEFTSIIKSKKFIGNYNDLDTSDDAKLTNLPRGYQNTNPAAEYIKLKSFVAIKKINDKMLFERHLITEATKAFEALMPFIKFLNQAIE